MTRPLFSHLIKKKIWPSVAAFQVTMGIVLLVIVPHAIFLVQLKSGSLALGGAIWMLCAVSELGMLVLMFLEGTKGDNQYGPDPKAGAA